MRQLVGSKAKLESANALVRGVLSSQQANKQLTSITNIPDKPTLRQLAPQPPVVQKPPDMPKPTTSATEEPNLLKTSLERVRNEALGFGKPPRPAAHNPPPISRGLLPESTKGLLFAKSSNPTTAYVNELLSKPKNNLFSTPLSAGLAKQTQRAADKNVDYYSPTFRPPLVGDYDNFRVRETPFPNSRPNAKEFLHHQHPLNSRNEDLQYLDEKIRQHEERVRNLSPLPKARPAQRAPFFHERPLQPPGLPRQSIAKRGGSQPCGVRQVHLSPTITALRRQEDSMHYGFSEAPQLDEF